MSILNLLDEQLASSPIHVYTYQKTNKQTKNKKTQYPPKESILLIPIVGRQRQGDLCEFKANLPSGLCSEFQVIQGLHSEIQPKKKKKSKEKKNTKQNISDFSRVGDPDFLWSSYNLRKITQKNFKLKLDFYGFINPLTVTFVHRLAERIFKF